MLGKLIGVLHEVTPGAKRIAILLNESNYVGGFAFRPGAGGGTQPDMRHSKPSIRLPCSKRVRLQVMMAPVAASSARRCRTFAIGTPVSLASSESSR